VVLIRELTPMPRVAPVTAQDTIFSSSILGRERDQYRMLKSVGMSGCWIVITRFVWGGYASTGQEGGAVASYTHRSVTWK